MKNFSWKTTLGGIVSVLMALGMLGKTLNQFLTGEPVAIEAITVAIGLLSGGLAAIFARDNDKTSEETGAKQFARERARKEAGY